MNHMNCSNEWNPLEAKRKKSNSRLIIKASSMDSPMAIEERETRYFEYQPVMREEAKNP